jgi:SAM-dependent methyltransferase
VKGDFPGQPAHPSLFDAFGAVEHFRDAAAYRQRYRRRPDVAFWCDLADELRGPILEYGCGSGRISLALAARGHRVTGVDRSHEMLAALQPVGQVEALAGDMRTLRLGRTFPLVLATFNTVLHLYTRACFEAFFARVHEHLAPGGVFAFDASVPVPRDLARSPQRPLTVGWVRRNGARARATESFDYQPLTQILNTSLVWRPETEGEEHQELLAQRQVFPAEWEALLHYNHFEILTVYADYQRIPPHDGCDVLIWLCRARDRRPVG